VKFGSEKDNPLGKLWFYPKNEGEPFELSQEKSEQVIVISLSITLRCFYVTNR